MVPLHKYEAKKGVDGSRRYAKVESQEGHDQQGVLHSPATPRERDYLTEKIPSTRLNLHDSTSPHAVQGVEAALHELE
ncbi:hypothetical protein TNCV_3627611 [Trichonephila clavipes]|nr:hypothetical protein TNCV_3627611 [Trichonephila clavipes]